MIDIDYFKKINDTYGHQNGDLVLTILTKELKKLFWEYDSIGRFGGEEFLIILPNTKQLTALCLMKRVLTSISKMDIKLSKSKTIRMTISAGVAQIQRDMDIDSLILSADSNLFQAKENGRNQVI